MRPPVFAKWLVNFLGLIDVPAGLKLMLVNASGQLSTQDARFVSYCVHEKWVRIARIWVLFYAATMVSAF